MSFRKLVTRRLAGALGLLLALSLALVPASALADAPPQMSHVFYGTVTVDGEDAPVGTVITASVAGLEYTYTTEVEGEYGYNPAPSFFIPAEGLEDGDLIEFYIGGLQAELYDVNADETRDSYPFEIGGATNLNLSVGEVPPPTLTAEAGGPYSGTEEESITLAGSASGGTSPYTFAWDLDNDGEYDDTTGASPSYTWETAGTYTIGLQVTDDADDTATDTATVTIIAEGEFDPYTYDEDEDGEISKDEALNAVTDYDAGNISKSDALAVIKLYFS